MHGGLGAAVGLELGGERASLHAEFTHQRGDLAREGLCGLAPATAEVGGGLAPVLVRLVDLAIQLTQP